MGWRDFLGLGPPITLNLSRVAQDASSVASVVNPPAMFEVRSSREPFLNLQTGQGTDRDPLSSEQPRWHFEPLRKEYIDSLYRMEGLARRVVELPPKYATQAGAESWTVRDSSEDAAPLEDVAVGLSLHQKVYEADVAARKYGDSAIFMVVEESGILDADAQALPLELDRVTGVRDLIVVEAHEMRIVEVQKELGADDGPSIGQPTLWQLSLNRNGVYLSLRVHASRLVMFHGAHVGYAPTTNTAKGWGHDSVLEGACGALMGMNRARRGRNRVFERIMTWFATTIFPKGKDNLKADAVSIMDGLKTRWSLLRIMTSLGVGLLDKEESIQQLNAPVSGVGELSETAAKDLCYTTGLPMGLIGGEIGGWSKGEGWEAAWRVEVSSYQKNRYLGPLTTLYTVFFAARGEVPKFTIVFAPLESMGPMETAQERLTRYQSYRVLVDIFGASIAKIIWRSVVQDGDRRDLQPAREGEEPDWQGGFQVPGSKVPAAVSREAAPGSAMEELARSVYGSEEASEPVEAPAQGQVQSLALNGAQVAALNADILESYRIGKMTEAGAVATIQMSYPATDPTLILKVVQGQIVTGPRPEESGREAGRAGLVDDPVQASETDADFSEAALLAFELGDDNAETWRDLRDEAAKIIPLEGHAAGDPMLTSGHLTLVYFGTVKKGARADAIRDFIGAFASIGAPEPEALGVRVFPAGPDGRCPIVIEFKPKGLSGLYRKALVALVRHVTATQFPKYRPHVTLGYARPNEEERLLLEALDVPPFLPLPELTLTWQGFPAVHLPLE